MANLKKEVTSKQSTPNFQKKEYSLPPDTQTYVRNDYFLENSVCFVILLLLFFFLFWDSPFPLITDEFQNTKSNISDTNTAWKVSKYGVFLVHFFSAFGLNTERCGVSLRIQSKCGKVRIRKTANTGIFHAVCRL